jgi:Tol biopolymer transport system component
LNISKVPGSEGLIHPRFSPDLRFLAGVTNFDPNPTQPTQLMLFDTQSKNWREIAQAGLINPVTWSNDSKNFYFQSMLVNGQPAFRFSTVTNKTSTFVDFQGLLQAGYARGSFIGFAPDGSLLVTLRRNQVNVYRLDLDLP